MATNDKPNPQNLRDFHVYSPKHDRYIALNDYSDAEIAEIMKQVAAGKGKIGLLNEQGTGFVESPIAQKQKTAVNRRDVPLNANLFKKMAGLAFAPYGTLAKEVTPRTVLQDIANTFIPIANSVADDFIPNENTRMRTGYLEGAIGTALNALGAKARPRIPSRVIGTQRLGKTLPISRDEASALAELATSGVKPHEFKYRANKLLDNMYNEGELGDVFNRQTSIPYSDILRETTPNNVVKVVHTPQKKVVTKVAPSEDISSTVIDEVTDASPVRNTENVQRFTSEAEKPNVSVYENTTENLGATQKTHSGNRQTQANRGGRETTRITEGGDLVTEITQDPIVELNPDTKVKNADVFADTFKEIDRKKSNASIQKMIQANDLNSLHEAANEAIESGIGSNTIERYEKALAQRIISDMPPEQAELATSHKGIRRQRQNVREEVQQNIAPELNSDGRTTGRYANESAYDSGVRRWLPAGNKPTVTDKLREYGRGQKDRTAVLTGTQAARMAIPEVEQWNSGQPFDDPRLESVRQEINSKRIPYLHGEGIPAK